MRLNVERGGSARGAGSSRPVVVSIDDPAATVGDLSGVLGFDPEFSLSIDGLVHEASARLRDIDLVEGSTVARADVVALDLSVAGTVWLGVSGGPGAGALVRAIPGTTISVGRESSNDLQVANTSVSARHARVHIDHAGSLAIEDLGSRNGTWVGGACISERTVWTPGQSVRMGSSLLSVHHLDMRQRLVGSSAEHADACGRVLLNRPPRSTGPTGPGPISLPRPVDERSQPVLAVVSLLAPLLFAGVMVAALGSWRYAIFGLLSPVIALGNWLSGRRRVNKQRTGDVAAQATALEQLARDLEAAEQLERRRRAAIAPDIVEIRRRVELPARELWERRRSSPDALTTRLGMGESSWDIPIEAGHDQPVPEAVAAVAAARRLEAIEVLLDLRDGPVGLVGDDEQARAAIRSLILQLCAHHGPADLQFAVFSTAERRAQWEWVDWLPHCSAWQNGGVFVGDAALEAATLVLDAGGDDPRQNNGTSPCWVVVVDDVELLHGRSSPVRRILALDGVVHGITLAESVDQLPSSTTAIVEIEPDDGLFTLRHPLDEARQASGGLDLVSLDVATDLARAMARFEDPEADAAGGSLPRAVTAESLGGAQQSADVIKSRWETQPSAGSLDFTLGQGTAGPVVLDLVADGPHALIAGTTGSGKSELLRSLVMGLALNHSPDDVVFVLVDYKGGSAFDRCGDLPHVVGVVTDLDEHLAERALQSLDAELKHRERILRAIGVSDIDQFRRAGSADVPLPRLVVIIDEFATLRQELPDFVSALVSIAQRGRSLGVHLILATQRPSGSVDANIRANANLRIALRVQSASDSIDIIDSPDAAQIDRRDPGRALVRRGEGELLVMQAAFLSGPPEGSRPKVRVVGRQTQRGAPSTSSGSASGEPCETRTELDVLVESIIEAAEFDTSPRRPWLEPLPSQVAEADRRGLEPLEARDAVVSFAVGDEPAGQRRVLRGWDPAAGHLGVTGVLGSGVTTTIRSVVGGLSDGVGDRPYWVFAADHAGGGLGGLEEWRHVSCSLEPAEPARHSRLLSYLDSEIERRRSLGIDEITAQPVLVLAIDGVGGFVEALGADLGTPAGDTLGRIGRDGPSLGVVMVLGASRVSEIPRWLRGQIRTHVLLEQADANEYANAGVRPSHLPNFVPGRALWSPDLMVCQVIEIEGSDAPASEGRDHREPPLIEELASVVDRTSLPGAAIEPHLMIPVGVADTTREPVALSIRPGEHAIVAGPSESGRTSALRLLAAQLRAASNDIVLVGVNPRGTGGLLEEEALDAGGALGEIEHVLAMAVDDDRRWVILIDDADQIDTDRGPLASLVSNRSRRVTIVAGLRSSFARGAHGHWTRSLRASGIGILLCPDNGVDGELFGIRLPRHEKLKRVPGRGYLVGPDGVDVVHVGI